MSSFKKAPGMEARLSRSPQVGQALLARAEAGAKAARSLAPVDTGAYREGIQAEAGLEGPTMMARINAYDYKSHWIEFGSLGRPAKAVLRRACDIVGLRLTGGRGG